MVESFLKSKKHVFWEAFLVTIVVFFLGLLIGFALESSRVDEIENYYSESEISLMDMLAFNNLLDNQINCGDLIKANIDFADKIYLEAQVLEDYEDSGKLSESIKISHRKYDLLRTFLWINSIKSLEKCQNNVDVVVYLYEYDTQDLTKIAEQKVWSKVLGDLKSERGDKLILIPIAINTDIITLETMVADFGVLKFPLVIINNNDFIDDISSVEDLEGHLVK